MTVQFAPSFPLQTLDVRGLPCTGRKAQIFGLFAELAPGESFQFINDHDPAGLRGIFDAIAPNGYDWAYVEEGPEAWRIAITRL